MTEKIYKNISFHKPSGRYLATYYVELPNGRKKRQGVYGQTKAEADEKREEILHKIQSSSTPKLTSKTHVEDFLYGWLEQAKKLKKSSKRGYEVVIRRHIVPRIGKMRLSALDIASVQWMMDDILAAGGSVRTTQIAKNILSKALKKAEAGYLVTPGIISHIELEAYHPKKVSIMTAEEGKKFLELAQGNKYEFCFLMYAIYGLRRGEALAIKWSDIDFENQIIHIERQYSKNGMKLEVHDLKTANSKRDLPLIPRIENCLLRYGAKRSDDYILAVDGVLPTPYQVDWQFKKIRHQLGREDITLHSLRHFAATELKDLKVPVKDVQSILGHSDPRITLQYYQHSNMDNKRAAFKTFAQAMSTA